MTASGALILARVGRPPFGWRRRSVAGGSQSWRTAAWTRVRGALVRPSASGSMRPSVAPGVRPWSRFAKGVRLSRTSAFYKPRARPWTGRTTGVINTRTARRSE